MFFASVRLWGIGVGLWMVLWAYPLLAQMPIPELNRVRGVWDLNNNLNSYWSLQAPAVLQGYGASPPGYVTESSYTFLKFVTANTNTQALAVPTVGGANGFDGALYMNNWTLVMDIRVPLSGTAADPKGYIALVQDQMNSGAADADFFIDQTGGLYVSAVGTVTPANTFPRNVWTRLGIRSVYNPTTLKQDIQYFINGNPVGSVASVTRDGQHALANYAYLFNDNGTETAPLDVNSVGFWSLGLSNSSVSAMGGASPGGLNWSGLPAPNTFPPLPVLTGVMKAGTITTTFSAALQQNDGQLLIFDPVVAGTVARVVLDLPAQDGKIPGKPRHYFDGLVTADVLPTGECKLVTDKAIQVLPDPVYGLRDVEPIGNILFERVATLLRSNGILGQNIKLHLPIGCQASASQNARRMKSVLNGTGSNLNLNASLIPDAALVTFGASSVGGIGGDPFYLAMDRVPVRWRTSELRWAPAAGTITAPADLSFNFHHREGEIAAMAALFRQRQSNDGMFRYAKMWANDLVMSARSGSYVSFNSFAVRLDPTKFGGTQASFETHFPAGWDVTWTGTNSQILYQNDSLSTSSKLFNAGSGMSTHYERGCPDPECDGPLTALPKSNRVMAFSPDSGEWKFTRDLGLSANGVPSVQSGTMLQWGYTASGIGHQVVQNFTTARALVAGSVLPGLDRTMAAQDSPAGMLLSGHTSPASTTLAERPGAANYADGAADYPGVNFRVAGTSTTAQSLLAGATSTAYGLTTGTKYYTRLSGVSGKHEAVAGSNTQFTALGGADFRISALRLGFLSGRNISSGVQGFCLVPMPQSSSFQLNFDRLIFGCSGALQGANLASTQPAITLSYWGTVFTPTALDFPQPKTCPSPGPGVGFIRLAGSSVFPALSSTAMSGTLGFYGGDLVTESLPVVNGIPLATGLGAISRFQPNGPVVVTAQGGTGWRVQPQGAAYLNRYDLRDSATVGSVNLNGLVDVPFFVDMPVHLSTSSAQTATSSSPVYFRSPLATEKYYDPEHRGWPAVTNLTTFLNSAAYDPRAKKSWLNIVDFNYGLQQNSTRNFKSRVPITNNALKVMTLEHKVLSLSPSDAELSFKGEVNIDPNDILSGITAEALLSTTSDLFPSASAASGALTTGASAIQSLDAIFADDLSGIFGLGLNQVAGTQSTSLHSQLAAAPTLTTLNAVRPALAQSIDGLFGPASSGLDGQWRRDLESKIITVENRLATLETLVGNAGDVLSLANSLRSRMGQGAAAGEDLNRLETARKEALAAVQRVRSSIAIARNALGGSGALALALADALPPQNSSVVVDLNDLVQSALDDLQAKWITQASAQGASFFTDHPASELRSDLTAALSDRVLGSAFGSQALSLVRMHLSDTQYELRQALDGTLATLKDAAKAGISDAAQGVLGTDLNSFTGMGSITGHARINGDTLNELRIDGKLHMALGGEALDSTDSLKVDGYFILRDVDSSTPDGACRAAFGAASEILVGASGSYSWGARTPGDSGTTGLAINGKFTLDNGGGIIGLAGDVALLGELGFQDVKFKDLKLGFGFGAGDAYLYGRGAASLKVMDVSAGVFFGQTCASNLAILNNVDKDISTVISTLGLNPAQTVLGAAVYAEGSMSLMPIIGIPPSCLLDLRVGGGQGVFIFKQGSQLVAGIKQSMSVRGEILCLVDVTGQLAYVVAGSANLDGSNLQAAGFGRATVRGEVGYDPFSWDFEKNLTMRVNAAPLTWKLDY